MCKSKGKVYQSHISLRSKLYFPFSISFLSKQPIPIIPIANWNTANDFNERWALFPDVGADYEIFGIFLKVLLLSSIFTTASIALGAVYRARSALLCCYSKNMDNAARNTAKVPAS